MRASSSDRGGFSLLELMLVLAILAVLAGPLVEIFTAARRTSFGADRRLRVSLHSQMLLGVLDDLRPGELPRSDGVLHDDVGGTAAGGGEPWARVRAFLDSPAPFQAARELTARELPGGGVVLRFRLQWLRLPGRPETRETAEVACLLQPRIWQ